MKIKLTLFVAFFAIFTFTSCEDNPLEGSFIDETGVGTGNGATGTTSSGSGSSTGDYWPRAINNQWVFNVNTGGTDTQIMSATINDSGKVFYNMVQAAGGAMGVAKEAASYFSRVVVDVNSGGYQITTAQPIYTKILQDDAVVGSTWENPMTVTYIYTPTAGGQAIPNANLNLNYKFTMVERDMTKIVNGQTYTNVLHVSLVLETQGQADTTGDYYYAKDVGVIENTIGARTITLSSYTLN